MPFPQLSCSAALPANSRVEEDRLHCPSRPQHSPTEIVRTVISGEGEEQAEGRLHMLRYPGDSPAAAFARRCRRRTAGRHGRWGCLI